MSTDETLGEREQRNKGGGLGQMLEDLRMDKQACGHEGRGHRSSPASCMTRPQPTTTPPVLVNEVAPEHLFAVCGCFCTLTAELGCCDTDHVTSKVQNIGSRALHRESLLTP